jgi:hypothetical protein
VHCLVDHLGYGGAKRFEQDREIDHGFQDARIESDGHDDATVVDFRLWNVADGHRV